MLSGRMNPVQVIENRSDVSGRVTDVLPHPTLPNHSLVRMQVQDVAPVEGFANLFDSFRGQTIDVALGGERARKLELRPGDSISARIRRAGPTSVFAEDNTV